MDYKSIAAVDQGIVIKGVKNFELQHIFDCGQCFRWHKQPSGSYIGIAFNRVIEVEKVDSDVIIHNTSEIDFYNIWENYFHLKRDYGLIKEELNKDPLLKKSMEFGHGIRLLQQEPFEIILSFIISSNNRIPMIRRAIEKISHNWGESLTYNGETYYAFPTLERLNEVTLEEFQKCSIGFRARYIKDTISCIYKSKYNDTMDQEDTAMCHENYDIYKIKEMTDDDCHNALKGFSGVGPKVADCIMLFSMEKYSAFPVDVWVKRAMQYFYLAPDVSLPKIREFARNKFNTLSGFAQQYLFYYARENHIKVE